MSALVERRAALPPRTAAAKFVPATIDAKARTVEVVWTSGAEVTRSPLFDEPYVEVLPIEGAQLDRLNAGAPLLDSHQRGTVRAVLGSVMRAWRDGTMGHAVVQFANTPEGEHAFSLVHDGTLRAISFAASVERFRLEPPPRAGELARMVALRWTPFELSLVSVGADPAAVVRSDAPTHECTVETMGDRGMDPTTDTTEPEVVRAHETNSAMPATDVREVRRIAGALDFGEAWALDQIERGASLADVRRAAVDEAVRQRAASPPTRASVLVSERGPAHNETQRDAMATALAGRHGHVPMTDAARPWASTPVFEMARVCLEARGHTTRMLGRGTIIERALHTTSDFPLLLADAANKVLLQTYQAAELGIRRIGRRSTAPDFRTLHRLQVGNYPALLEVGEHGEFTYGTIGEQDATYTVKTYGRIFGITRQALVNDDVGAFAELAARIGIAVREFEAAALAAVVASNPTFSDSVAIFHSTHANLAGSAAAISAASLTIARAAMRKQKGLDGTTVIDVPPRYLVVSPDKETEAEQVVAALSPQQVSNVNPFSGRLEVVVDAHLTGNAWYVFADPAALPSIEYSYLAGAEGPRIESRAGFEVDGLETKVALDFGCGWLDWRGAFKNAGA